jgi:hypothetical protein
LKCLYQDAIDSVKLNYFYFCRPCFYRFWETEIYTLYVFRIYADIHGWTNENLCNKPKVLLTFKLLKLFHKPVVLLCDILMLYSKFIKFTTYEIVFIEPMKICVTN